MHGQAALLWQSYLQNACTWDLEIKRKHCAHRTSATTAPARVRKYCLIELHASEILIMGEHEKRCINHQRIRIIVKIGVYTFLHSLDDRNEIQKKPTIFGEDLARCILCRVICAQNRPSADTPILCRIGSSFDLKPQVPIGPQKKKIWTLFSIFWGSPTFTGVLCRIGSSFCTKWTYPQVMVFVKNWPCTKSGSH